MTAMWWPRRALPQRVLVAGALAMIPIVLFAVVASEFVSAITRWRII